ncbi:MAG TPA: hypothetical protein VHO28_06790 [Ignavibacteriales bacterium]|jgi:hypothetical protein|nr:hypothetical protein [Ignavibacteriales bacterium]HEX3073697.1 hypothetical protein [Ignavibacteriales bacterium]
MKDKFEDYVFKEIDYKSAFNGGNVIKAEGVNIVGKTKVNVEEESHDGVKVIIRKDEHDVIKEIKFVCTCGQSKSITLDYNEE